MVNGAQLAPLEAVDEAVDDADAVEDAVDDADADGEALVVAVAVADGVAVAVLDADGLLVGQGELLLVGDGVTVGLGFGVLPLTVKPPVSVEVCPSVRVSVTSRAPGVAVAATERVAFS
jgi:hypothetical protein